MVYRGKPSRACSECRIKRRKCDFSRPACRPCVRAGSRCDGYRDGNLLAFQDQTTETFCKSSVVTDDRSGALISGRSHQVKVHQYKQWSNHDPWYKISVTHEEQAQNFFFHHYVMCESGQTQTNPDCHGIIYKRATEPGYLANLVNAVGLRFRVHFTVYARRSQTLVRQHPTS
ncbi:hypothetical protein EDB82DRAFT_119554 [Fusarium venenatum]|uniref:uncharacterized protein n=1 Tax=Fusarium venenatum TaxID=56646 RepID=UPI001DC7F50B|nr:hypothetical protein EDB82DRAFT_119554 [Fusarium venenatum]